MGALIHWSSCLYHCFIPKIPNDHLFPHKFCDWHNLITFREKPILQLWLNGFVNKQKQRIWYENHLWKIPYFLLRWLFDVHYMLEQSWAFIFSLIRRLFLLIKQYYEVCSKIGLNFTYDEYDLKDRTYQWTHPEIPTFHSIPRVMTFIFEMLKQFLFIVQKRKMLLLSTESKN